MYLGIHFHPCGRRMLVCYRAGDYTLARGQLGLFRCPTTLSTPKAYQWIGNESTFGRFAAPCFAVWFMASLVVPGCLVSRSPASPAFFEERCATWLMRGFYKGV